MIRVVIFLVAIAALAFGAAWLADRPGDVLITWQGLRIQTSVAVLAMAMGAMAALAVAAWSILRVIVRSPTALKAHLRERTARRGYLALSQGLIAVGSGDARAARKLAEEAARIAPGEPLTLLLTAQSAQLAGDRAAAERTFKAMALRDDTKLFGLHGLFIEARRRQDAATARLIAEEAARANAAPAWAAHAVLELRCAAGDWIGAIERLERNQRAGLLDKKTYQRQRAVLLTARALAVEPTDRGGARVLALAALKLAPSLVPAAALAGRLLGEAGELRQAARVIETAWMLDPHPELAETYAHLRIGDSARDRLARIETLAQRAPGHVESALAVAQAALDAREFAVARAALEPLAGAPTQRVALTFAKLEELEHGDMGRSREWMTRALRARRDPAWTADGYISDHWLPVSPVTGRLDAFTWTEPLAQIGSTGAVIEADEEGAPAVAAATPVPQAPAVPKPAAEPPPVEAAAPTAEPRAAAAPAAMNVEKVIPLLHAPDDPGPEGELPPEAASDVPPMSRNLDWLRGLLK